MLLVCELNKLPGQTLIYILRLIDYYKFIIHLKNATNLKTKSERRSQNLVTNLGSDDAEEI